MATRLLWMSLHLRQDASLRRRRPDYPRTAFVRKRLAKCLSCASRNVEIRQNAPIGHGVLCSGQTWRIVERFHAWLQSLADGSPGLENLKERAPRVLSPRINPPSFSENPS